MTECQEWVREDFERCPPHARNTARFCPDVQNPHPVCIKRFIGDVPTCLDHNGFVFASTSSRNVLQRLAQPTHLIVAALIFKLSHSYNSQSDAPPIEHVGEGLSHEPDLDRSFQERRYVLPRRCETLGIICIE